MPVHHRASYSRSLSAGGRLSGSQRTRVIAEREQQFALVQPLLSIEAQQIDGDTSDCGQRLDVCAVEPEVFRPDLLARIEKRDDLPACRPIDRTEIAALIAVAPVAAQAEVVFGGFPTVFLGNDMIDGEVDGAVTFTHEAVFTAVLSALDDLAAKGSRNVSVAQLACAFSLSFAFALTSVSR